MLMHGRKWPEGRVVVSIQFFRENHANQIAKAYAEQILHTKKKRAETNVDELPPVEQKALQLDDHPGAKGLLNAEAQHQKHRVKEKHPPPQHIEPDEPQDTFLFSTEINVALAVEAEAESNAAQADISLSLASGLQAEAEASASVSAAATFQTTSGSSQNQVVLNNEAGTYAIGSSNATLADSSDTIVGEAIWGSVTLTNTTIVAPNSNNVLVNRYSGVYTIQNSTIVAPNSNNTLVNSQGSTYIIEDSTLVIPHQTTTAVNSDGATYILRNSKIIAPHSDTTLINSDGATVILDGDSKVIAPHSEITSQTTTSSAENVSPVTAYSGTAVAYTEENVSLSAAATMTFQSTTSSTAEESETTVQAQTEFAVADNTQIIEDSTTKLRLKIPPPRKLGLSQKEQDEVYNAYRKMRWEYLREEIMDDLLDYQEILKDLITPDLQPEVILSADEEIILEIPKAPKSKHANHASETGQAHSNRLKKLQ